MRVMTEAVQAIFEKANEGQPDTTQTICGYYGRACREMGRKPGRMPCLSCPLAKFLEGAERIIPTEGTTASATSVLPPPARRIPATPPPWRGSRMAGP